MIGAARAARDSARGSAREERLKLARRTVLAALFFFHPVAHTLIGKAYFAATGLNNMFRPIGINVLAQPAIVLSVLFVLLTPTSRRFTALRPRGGVSIALGLWFAGAAFALLVNSQAELVPMTFFAVFVASLFVYVALSNYSLDDGDVEVIFVGLAAGVLLPLASGLMAFYGMWGAPSLATVITAHASEAGIQAYEDATFGSRGNTASLIVLVGPPLLALALDARRSVLARVLCGLASALVVVNLLILQQRTVILIYIASMAFLWRFRAKTASAYLIYAACAAIVIYGGITLVPEVEQLIEDRFMPALMLDAETDTSVEQRERAIRDGISLATANVPFGLGPGSAIVVHPDGSAHQLNVQQALECGVLGLLGSLILVIAVPLLLVRTVSRRERTPEDTRRFLFILGPACYVVHGAISNVAINFGYVNSWAVLVVAMLALTPSLRARRHRAEVPRRAASPPVFRTIEPLATVASLGGAVSRSGEQPS